MLALISIVFWISSIISLIFRIYYFKTVVAVTLGLIILMIITLPIAFDEARKSAIKDVAKYF